MPVYKLIISKTAQKQLDKLNDTLVLRLIEAIYTLAQNPRPAGCKKLKAGKVIASEWVTTE